MTNRLFNGDCLEILPTIESASVDCVVSDPPYPEIDRDYGRMTEAEWMDMMQEVVRQTRRILKPTGSAVFILQPNSEKVGKMRPWLWKFMAWCCEEWNIVQDAYWWNFNIMPSVHASKYGLMRGSVKPSVWIGEPNCHRNQLAVLAEPTDRTKKECERIKTGKQAIYTTPSGYKIDTNRAGNAWKKRGGVTPFNLLPFSNGSNNKNTAARHGHGAGTPQALTDWWTRYLCPPGGVVADWFCGTGTSGLSAAKYGNSFIGIEKMAKYYEVSKLRLDEAYSQPQAQTLFAEQIT